MPVVAFESKFRRNPENMQSNSPLSRRMAKCHKKKVFSIAYPLFIIKITAASFACPQTNRSRNITLSTLIPSNNNERHILFQKQKGTL